VIIRATDDNPPFYVGKVLELFDDGTLTVHWHGNLHNLIHGSFKPGWLRFDGEPYFSTTVRKDDPLYTNINDKMVVRRSDVTAHSFQLTGDHKLPSTVWQVISDDPGIEWQSHE
jgi:hypothetical protein